MSSVLIVDLVVAALVLGYAARGWRTGLLSGALGIVGLVGGVVGGLWIGPRLLALLPGASDWAPIAGTLTLLMVVVACAVLGGTVLGAAGRTIRERRGTPVRKLDSLLGALGGALVSALTIGVLTSSVQPIVPNSWARTLDGSRVLREIHNYTPAIVTEQAERLTGLLERAGFPRVFAGLEPSLPVEAPDDTSVGSAGVQAAAASVVKVLAPTPDCGGWGSAASGSGWVASAERVVTNAHVVAGAQDITVQVAGSTTKLDATVVAFEPNLDLAVLLVPGLSAQPLARSAALPATTEVAVAGFPGGGPYTVVAGRVRGTIDAAGHDIYGTGDVVREVYSLRTTVQPGNSGGPLLTTEGAVAGTIFARSVADPSTGYALTGAQQSAFIDAAATDTTPASTATCLR